VILARNGAPQLIIFAIIIIAVVISRIAEYLRKQKAQKEAKERRLREGPGASEPQARAGGKPAKPPPVAGGLQALLEALEGRAKPQEAEISAREGPEPVMAPVTATVMDPATAEHERARAAEERAREASTFEEFLAEHPEEPEPGQAFGSAEPGPVDEGLPEAPPAPRVALAAAGLFAGGGRAPIREEARRGVLWTVVLGPPRGVVPYGERGAAEPPGGIR
jgi:hypothetical protein